MVQASQIVEGQRYDIGGAVYVGRNGRLELEAAPGASPIVTRRPDPRLPYQTERERVGLRRDINETEASDFAARRAEADARKAEADARASEAALAAGGGTPAQRAVIQTRRANMEAAAQQLQRVASLYRNGYQNEAHGLFSSLAQMFPDMLSESNQQFNAAAAGLSEAAFAGLRVPGVGTQSNVELEQFLRANQPSAQSYDQTIEERLDTLQTRLNAQRAELGLTPIEWRTPPPSQPEGAPAPLGERPVFNPGADGTTALAGGDAERMERDPVAAQIGARLSNMIAQGVPDAEIREYAREAGRTSGAALGNLDEILRFRRTPQFQTWKRQHPNQGYPLGESWFSRPVAQSNTERAVSSAAQSPVGAYSMSAGNALLGNRLDDVVGAFGGNAEQARAGMAAVRDENPMSSLAGDISGAMMAYGGGNMALGGLGRTGAARFVPQASNTWRARAGDAAYGLYSGTGDDYGDAPAGVVANVAGGMFGRSLARGGGRAFSGARDNATRYLTERGVPLTLGQMAGQGGRFGQALRGMEERLSGAPLIGSFVQGQYRRGLEGFNRAAFDEALAPIGGQNAGRLGEDALENAGALRGQAYDNALSGVNLQIDPTLTADLAAARTQAQAIPNLADQFNFTMSRNVDPYLAQQGGFSGRDFQTAVRGLRRARSDGMRELNGYDLGQSFGAVEGALTGAVNRQAPGVMPALSNANQANQRISILRDAVRGGQANVEQGDPVFTPFRLGQSSIANTVKYGGRDAAMSTDRPFFDLARTGQELLPNRVPDSGTAGRLMVPLLATGALGGAGAGSDALGLTDRGALGGLALGSALTAPYTNRGQRLIQTIAARRPRWARNFGEAMLGNPDVARAAGMFGAPIPPYYLTEDQGGY